jgi:DNA invertase Pin-like site-specific DNA recombinase
MPKPAAPAQAHHQAQADATALADPPPRKPLPPAPKPPTPPAQEADLVDRIFEFLREDPRLTVLEPQALQQLKAAVRAEFRGEECYIASRPASARQELVSQVLSMFNGRNATEVARALSIGRATVYRVLKQSSRRSVAPPA